MQTQRVFCEKIDCLFVRWTIKIFECVVAGNEVVCLWVQWYSGTVVFYMYYSVECKNMVYIILCRNNCSAVPLFHLVREGEKWEGMSYLYN